MANSDGQARSSQAIAEAYTQPDKGNREFHCDALFAVIAIFLHQTTLCSRGAQAILLPTMSVTKVVETSEAASNAGTSTKPARSEHESDLDRHPLGIRPGGNALTSTENDATASGSFVLLPDALLLVVLEYLDQADLIALGSTCRSLFAYCSYDQLWRDLATSRSGGELEWRGSWRSSLRGLATTHLPEINCRNVFSDVLHRPFLCSRIDVQRFANETAFPKAIPRLDDLTTDVFNESWTARPFMMTQPVKRWPVYQAWSWKVLEERFSETTFRAEAVDWSLRQYMSYSRTTVDESPLYLFDRAFVDKMGLSVGPDGDYDAPLCFQEDLFTVLGDERPDHRWLIVGPERSGSTFHKDPNATSAWNAVIRGSKYWIMFPPSVLPPGVFVSDDHSEVTSPLSIAEWLLSFHDEARSTPGCIEGICNEGEVLHVPSGWWHLVVNLEPAIAITQNFVPRSHLNGVVHFLDKKRAQISGFKDGVSDPLKTFLERLEEVHPDMAAELDRRKTNGAKKRKWEEVVAPSEIEQTPDGGFSFGFGDDLESETGD